MPNEPAPSDAPAIADASTPAQSEPPLSSTPAWARVLRRSSGDVNARVVAPHAPPASASLRPGTPFNVTSI